MSAQIQSTAPIVSGLKMARTRPGFAQEEERRTQQILHELGPEAFQSPFWSTCCHESGHAIFESATAIVPESIAVWELEPEGLTFNRRPRRSWSGRTVLPEARIPRLAAGDIHCLRIAGSFLAGVAAETLLISARFPGLTVGEVLAGEYIARDFAAATGRDGDTVVSKVHQLTAEILRVRKKQILSVARALEIKRRLLTTDIEKLLERMTRIDFSAEISRRLERE